MSFTCDCISLVATVNSNQLPVKIKYAVKETAKLLNCICPTLIDVITAMTSHCILYKDLFKNESFLNRFVSVTEFSGCIKTSGTAYENLALIFRIKVQKHLSGYEVRLKSHSTVKTGLFGSREQTFDFSALEITVKKCKLSCDSYSAVCTKCSIRSYHPTILYDISDRILGKVMFHPFILLANHIRMALKDNYRHIFISRCCFFRNQYVAGCIGLACKFMRCSKFLEICNDMLFMAGFSWNHGYFLEIRKDFFCCHIYNY